MPSAASARPAEYTAETTALQGTVGELTTTHVMPCNVHLYVQMLWAGVMICWIAIFPTCLVGGSLPSRRPTGGWRL